MLHWWSWAPPPVQSVPPTTPYTRGFLRATDVTNAWALLGLQSTNQTEIVSPASADLNMGGYGITNFGDMIGTNLLFTGTITGVATGLTNASGSAVLFADDAISSTETSTNITLNIDKPLYVPTNVVAVAYEGSGALLTGITTAKTNCIRAQLSRRGASTVYSTEYDPAKYGYATNGVGLPPETTLTTSYSEWIVPQPSEYTTNLFRAVVLFGVPQCNVSDGLVVALGVTNQYYPTSGLVASPTEATNDVFAVDDPTTAARLMRRTYTLSPDYMTNMFWGVRVNRKGNESVDTFTNNLHVISVAIEYSN